MNECITYSVSLACTLKRESSSEPAAVVAVATLLCSLLVSAAIAAFLNASCMKASAHELQDQVVNVVQHACARKACCTLTGAV